MKTFAIATSEKAVAKRQAEAAKIIAATGAKVEAMLSGEYPFSVDGKLVRSAAEAWQVASETIETAVDMY